MRVDDSDQARHDTAGDEARNEYTPNTLQAIGYTVDGLARLTRITRFLGIIGMTLTLTNLGTTAGLLPILPATTLTGYVYAPIILCMTTLAVLGLQESFRKRGDAYFQELSDSLHVVFGITDGRQFTIVQRGRIAARNFSSAADLPFFPGRHGPAVYAAVNLVLMIMWIFGGRWL